MKHLIDGRGGSQRSALAENCQCRIPLRYHYPAMSGSSGAEGQQPGGLLLASPAVATLQAIDGDNKVGPLEHLNQPVKDALLVVRARL